LDSSTGQNPNYRQSQKKKGNHIGLVLHVQDKWRVGKSFAFALPNCSGAMEFDFDFIWSSLGDALGCGRPSRLLE
jgi:hypothetical protein